MREPVLKKKEKQGFDLLEAIYAEKGLISTGDSSHLMASKAIGDTRAHSVTHHRKEKERHRAAFTENVRVRTRPERAKFVEISHGKQNPKLIKMPPQMKKPDINDPKKGKKR